MEQYQVTGMSCAACSSRVEKAVSAVPGVTSCSVSLLTNSMGVEGTAAPEAIIQAVTDAGYGASLRCILGLSGYRYVLLDQSLRFSRGLYVPRGSVPQESYRRDNGLGAGAFSERLLWFETI